MANPEAWSRRHLDEPQAAHAEEFTAHPDAWRQLTARRRRRARPRWSRLSGPALIPLAAAAVLVAIAAAILLVRGEVGFWSPIWGGTISPQVATAGPAVGGLGKHAITATAYDEAGHVLGQARLGRMP
jgi:hypothetical protein